MEKVSSMSGPRPLQHRGQSERGGCLWCVKYFCRCCLSGVASYAKWIFPGIRHSMPLEADTELQKEVVEMAPPDGAIRAMVLGPSVSTNWRSELAPSSPRVGSGYLTEPFWKRGKCMPRGMGGLVSSIHLGINSGPFQSPKFNGLLWLTICCRLSSPS